MRGYIECISVYAFMCIVEKKQQAQNKVTYAKPPPQQTKT